MPIIIIAITIYILSRVVLIRDMTIFFLFLRLAPGIVPTIFFWFGGSDIAARPKSSRRQTKINGMRMIVIGTIQISEYYIM